MTPKIIPPPKTVFAMARTNPLSPEVVRVDFPVGSSIRDMVGPDTRPIRVEIGGMTIPEEMWEHVRPKPTVAVVIIAIPQGGSVKNIFRIVAFAALAVGVALTAGLAGTVLPAFLGGATLTTTTAGLLAAGVGLVGSLIINAIIPPQTPATSASGGDTDLLKSITGTQNQLTPFGAIGVAMGASKVFPVYAAKPFTELLGDDQYLRCLFDCGAGDPLISDMRIGDTDIASYTDVETQISTNPSLFSQDVEEVSVGVTMSADGNNALRTSTSNAQELSIDWSYSAGLFGLDSNGNVVAVTSNMKLEYRPHDGSTWTTVTSSTPGLTISNSAAIIDGSGNIAVTNGARKAVRIGLRWNVDIGQYDVQLTRVSTNWGTSSSDSRVGDLVWTVIRTIRPGVVSSTGTTKIALRIKANDQLNGSLSSFNCILSQQVPVWHPELGAGGEWVTELSDNPAWLYLWMLKDCPANARRVPIERIDLDEIKAFGADCDAKGFGFNTFIDSATTVFALIKDILAAGRATFNVNDGLYSLVRDVEQTVPVQVFTPRNSWGFGGTRAFPDAVHALRMQFINPEANWQQDERIVYDDGYGDAAMVAANPSLTLASKFEVMQIRGCTDPDQAWRLGRYYLANGRLRHTTYSWNADPEHLVCRRGKLVQVANDIIGVGTGWGRITFVADNGTIQTAISMDEHVSPETGKTYGVRIRRQNGTVYLSQVTFDTTLPKVNYFTLTTPLAHSGDQAANLNEGDLVLFGEWGNDRLDLVVTKIEPADDFNAKITAVEAAPSVLTADSGTVPTWVSEITGQVQDPAPEPPSEVTVTSVQALAPTDDAGITQPVMMISVYGPWSGSRATGHVTVDHIEIRYRQSDPVGAWTNLVLAYGERSATVYDITRAADYQIEARAVAPSGAASLWTANDHTTSGADDDGIDSSKLPPGVPANFYSGAIITTTLDTGTSTYTIHVHGIFKVGGRSYTLPAASLYGYTPSGGLNPSDYFMWKVYYNTKTETYATALNGDDDGAITDDYALPLGIVTIPTISGGGPS